jgi:hypothetical protein
MNSTIESGKKDGGRRATGEGQAHARRKTVIGLRSTPRVPAWGQFESILGSPETLRNVERKSWKAVFLGTRTNRPTL